MDYPTSQNTSSSQVAIYNEDDLSHLLFLEPADHGSHIITGDNKVGCSEAKTLVESPLSADTHGNTLDDESAILTDPDEESDLEIAPSPSRRRGGTLSISDDGFEFPLSLSRQQDVETHVAPVRPAPRRVDPVSTLSQREQHILPGTDTHVQIVEAEHEVSPIEGALMSWWPAPMGDRDYDQAEKNRQATISWEKHIPELEGPLMAWWPTLAEMSQHEWNERFYE